MKRACQVALMVTTESVSSLGGEARGPKAAGRRELPVAGFFPFSVGDTWFPLNLTFLKPWANQCVFLMEMFFFSYASEIMYLLWDFTFFKLVLPETNFCLKPWADNGSTDQYSCQLFHGWGLHTLCHSISKTLIVGEGPGDTPPALRCLLTRDKVCPNPCPLSPWWHPTISSSVIPSCPQSFPASGSLQMTQLFASGGQRIAVSASASVLPMDIQDWFPLGWTGQIFLQSKGLWRVFSLSTMCLVAMGIRFLWPSWPPRLTNMRFHTKISHCQKDCNNPLYSQSPL